VRRCAGVRRKGSPEREQKHGWWMQAMIVQRKGRVTEGRWSERSQQGNEGWKKGQPSLSKSVPLTEEKW